VESGPGRIEGWGEGTSAQEGVEKSRQGGNVTPDSSSKMGGEKTEGEKWGEKKLGAQWFKSI